MKKLLVTAALLSAIIVPASAGERPVIRPCTETVTENCVVIPLLNPNQRALSAPQLPPQAQPQVQQPAPDTIPPPIAAQQLPAPPMPPPEAPPPLGWVNGQYLSCDSSGCVANDVAANGINVLQFLGRGPVTVALMNGVPVTVVAENGPWVQIIANCPLEATNAWSRIADIPLLACAE